MFILLLPIVHSLDLDECSRHGQLSNDIPCVVISSFVPAGGCNKVALIHLNNTLVQTQNWTTGNPFCELQWNISTAGTYVTNSSVEDFIITVEVEDNMLATTFVFMLLMLYFTIIGFLNMKKSRILTFLSFALSIVELLMMVTITWLTDTGTSINGILRINWLIMLILGGGIGLLSLFMFSLRMVNVGDALHDDEKAKWQKDQWKW